MGERKLAHIAHLLHASDDVALVVAADKLHNVESLVDAVRADGPAVFAAFKGGAGGMVWYFEQVRAALADRFPVAFVARWDTAMATLTTSAAQSTVAPTAAADHARLWSHLVGRHACIVARDTGFDELTSLHTHEHTGPGTIRNHDRADLASDPHRVAAVLADAVDDAM